MCEGFFGQILAFLLLLHVYNCRVENKSQYVSRGVWCGTMSTLSVLVKEQEISVHWELMIERILTHIMKLSLV
jgi:hypothetical protein